MKLNRILMTLFLFFCSGYVGAATLHAIIVADTLDRSIKAEKDRDHIKKMVATVSQATGLKPNLQVLDDDIIAPRGDGYQKVKAAVEQLQSAPNDVVLFYYAGHGKNTAQSGSANNSLWPALSVEGIDTPNDKLIELSWVEQTIKKKGPRLFVALADTCNELDRSHGRSASAETTLPESGAYKALFLESQGSVVASAAIPGQKAFSNTETGGYFTQAFLASLRTELKSVNPRWETVMANTEKGVETAHPGQTPQAEVHMKTVSVSNDNDTHEPSQPEVTTSHEPPAVTVQKLTVDKFDNNSTKLKSTHQSQLREWNQGLSAAKSATPPKVTVEGHADSRGSDEHNMDLSKQRAKTVKDYLVKKLGTDPNRLEVVPYGESRPVASNETESGRAKNRRVELVSESLTPPVADQSEKNALTNPESSTPVETPPESGTTTLSSPIEPIKVCPKETSMFGTCYWGDDSNDGKKWSVFVEEKLWLNTWTGWGSVASESRGESSEAQFDYKYEKKDDDALISMLSDSELASIVTLGFRYDKFSLGFSVLPKQSYSFPVYITKKDSVTWWHLKQNEDKSFSTEKNYVYSNEKISAEAEREEIDITVGYSILPQLQVGLGFKRMTLDYEYYHRTDNPFGSPFNLPLYYDWRETREYKTYGGSLNVGGQVCLASWLGTNISIFGNFSYGLMQTREPDGSSSPTKYHSTDLGLAFELPKLKKLIPEIRLGYRAQTMYTEIPIGGNNTDATDVTEGFTLALRVTY